MRFSDASSGDVRDLYARRAAPYGFACGMPMRDAAVTVRLFNLIVAVFLFNVREDTE
jgi:hypothetical protein